MVIQEIISESTLLMTEKLNNNFTTLKNACEGKEDKLDITQKRKITYGTASPSGGSEGDIYIQYS